MWGGQTTFCKPLHRTPEIVQIFAQFRGLLWLVQFEKILKQQPHSEKQPLWAYCTSPSQKCNDFHGRPTLLGKLSSHEKETIFVTEKCALHYNNFLHKRANITHTKNMQECFKLCFNSAIIPYMNESLWSIFIFWWSYWSINWLLLYWLVGTVWSLGW